MRVQRRTLRQRRREKRTTTRTGLERLEGARCGGSAQRNSAARRADTRRRERCARARRGSSSRVDEEPWRESRVDEEPLRERRRFGPPLVRQPPGFGELPLAHLRGDRIANEHPA